MSGDVLYVRPISWYGIDDQSIGVDDQSIELYGYVLNGGTIYIKIQDD